MNVLLLPPGGEAAARAGALVPSEALREGIASWMRGGSQRIVLVQRAGDPASRAWPGPAGRFARDAVILTAPARDRGLACTALHAREHVDNGDELVVVAGGDLPHAGLAALPQAFRDARLDAGALVRPATGPHGLRVCVDAQGRVTHAADDRRTGADAAAGLWWFARGADLVRAAETAIRKDVCVDGTFCIGTALNQLILERAAVGALRIGAMARGAASARRALQAG